MIESIQFTNFKALKNTALPLTPFTLLMGPNGAGKSTVLEALRHVAFMARENLRDQATRTVVELWSSLANVTADKNAVVEVKLSMVLNGQRVVGTFQVYSDGRQSKQFNHEDHSVLTPEEAAIPSKWLSRIRTYVLDPEAIAEPAAVDSGAMNNNGGGLVAVLDDLKDNHPERWGLLLDELREWLPEYDHIQFDKPMPGKKGLALRTKVGGHRIPAKHLSQGTLVALALLTLAYSPEPPSLVGLEEIDRSLHPRLLRKLQDALYRLSYPESCGEKRAPIQVIATTHSPYLLDLYRDHPEEVVLAHKEDLEVQMRRLTDTPHFKEILGDAPLGDVWYSGVLGGVVVRK